MNKKTTLSDLPSSLITLIPWAIERILKGEYRVIITSKGEVLKAELNPEYGIISIELMEKGLRSVLSAEQASVLFALKDEHTEEDVKKAMIRLFDPKLGPLLSDRLIGADWSAVVTLVYEQSISLWESLGKAMAKDRETFGTVTRAQFEATAESRNPRALLYESARKYAQEFITLYPKVVDRAATLRIVGTARKVPSHVERHMLEASRCFVYGQFLGCLILCRSAIEAATENQLRDKGHGTKVNQVTKDWLKGLLLLARDNGLLDYDEWNWADSIRDLANRTVHHSKLPDAEECKEAFYLTRKILERLYN
jgi:hypothetical protein